MSSILIGVAVIGVAAVILWISKVEKKPEYGKQGLFAIKEEKADDSS